MKKIIIIVISSILAAIILAFGITAAVLYAPRGMTEIIDGENIVSITMIHNFDYKEAELVELSEDKFAEFIEIAKPGKYVKRYNWRKLKCIPWVNISFIIKYPDRTVEFDNVHYSIRNDSGDLLEQKYFIKYYNDNYDKLQAMFEE